MVTGESRGTNKWDAPFGVAWAPQRHTHLHWMIFRNNQLFIIISKLGRITMETKWILHIYLGSPTREGPTKTREPHWRSCYHVHIRPPLVSGSSHKKKRVVL